MVFAYAMPAFNDATDIKLYSEHPEKTVTYHIGKMHTLFREASVFDASRGSHVRLGRQLQHQAHRADLRHPRPVEGPEDQGDGTPRLHPGAGGPGQGPPA